MPADNLLAGPPRIQRRTMKSGSKKPPKTLLGTSFARGGSRIVGSGESVSSGLTMKTVTTRGSSSMASVTAAAKAARKKSLAEREQMYGQTNSTLTQKAMARRRKKVDRIAGGAGAKIMLETAPNNPIMRRGNFDTLTPKSSPTEEQNRLRATADTPSTASLSSPEDLVDNEGSNSGLKQSCAGLDKYAMSDPDELGDKLSPLPSSGSALPNEGANMDINTPVSSDPSNTSSSSPLRPRSLGPAFDADEETREVQESMDGVEVLNTLDIKVNEDWDCTNNKIQSKDSFPSSDNVSRRNHSADDLSCAATDVVSNSKRDVYPSYDTEHNKIRHHAAKEWEVGTERNSRYNYNEGDTRNMSNGSGPFENTLSETNGSSIFNKSEIFHENAVSAIVSLLGPKRVVPDDCARNDSIGIPRVVTQHESSHEDAAPISPGRQIPSIKMVSAAPMSPMSQHEWEEASSHISKITTPLVDAETERLLDSMRKQMPEPNQQMADLLTIIHRPLEESGVAINRGYMSRRKNACGALKVMAAKPSSRTKICWTQGVLTSLTTVLNDSGDGDLDAEYPDNLTRLAYIEARKRAVATILYLVTPTKNRILLFHSPGLIRALAKVMHEDEGECRQGCSAIVAYLAKTHENRLLLVQVESIIDAAILIITPKGEGDSNDNEKIDGGRHGDKGELVKESGSKISERNSKLARRRKKGGKKESKEEQAVHNMTDPNNMVDEYDSDPNQFLHGSRANIFAALVHLSKEKENTFFLARNKALIKALISVSDKHASPSHVRAIIILANLTRNKDNTTHLVFHVRAFLPMLVRAMHSTNVDCRRHAVYAIWNLSADATCRHEIGNVHNLLAGLCKCALTKNSDEEQLAASGALKNLSDEPSNLIPMTNAPQCLATLMELTNVREDKLNMVQYNACDALATLSHWLRKIATGAEMIGVRKRDSTTLGSNLPLGQENLFCPLHQVALYDPFE